MITQRTELMSRLLREIELESGTSDLSNMVLEALVDSIKSLKVKNGEDFCRQFRDLCEIFLNTEPKFGFLIYHLGYLFEDLKNTVAKEKFLEGKWKKILTKRIRAILKDAKLKRQQVLKYAEQIDIEGKTILIHDHSHTVQSVLAHLMNIGRRFRVVIAEQDIEKTHDNIERLQSMGVPFYVVPAYMLSHVHDQIDMLFFGALTLKDTMHFVMDPGTHGIISEFHFAKIPGFMFINTAKFSLWKSKKRSEIFIHKHSREHHLTKKEYERIKYSHDRVPADLFKSIVTNEGIFTPAGLKKLYAKKYAQHLKRMKDQ